jgi:hypothetical protein
MRVYGHIRTIPPATRPRWVYNTPREAYAVRRRQTEQALPTTHAVARSKNLTLRQRLHALRSHPGSRSSAPSARRPPPHKSRPSPPPLQRFLGGDAIRPPPGDRHRHNNMLLRPCSKLKKLAKQARQLLQRATRASRWLPVKEIQSFACHAQYLFLAIPAARFFLRELRSVLGDKWGGRVRLTPQLRRDLQWCTQVLSHANGKNIHRPVESAYIHCDSSGHGWGGNTLRQTRSTRLLGPEDEHQHITWKEMKAVRLAVLSFLLHLAGRNILLHEDNHAVCYVMAGLTSRSPDMLNELRRLWYLLDTNNIHIRLRYIRSAANMYYYGIPSGQLSQVSVHILCWLSTRKLRGRF